MKVSTNTQELDPILESSEFSQKDLEKPKNQSNSSSSV
jgi:hypothetical protein